MTRIIAALLLLAFAAPARADEQMVNVAEQIASIRTQLAILNARYAYLLALDAAGVTETTAQPQAPLPTADPPAVVLLGYADAQQAVSGSSQQFGSRGQADGNGLGTGRWTPVRNVLGRLRIFGGKGLLQR